MYDKQDLLAGMTVLVVDDVSFSLNLVAGMLREMSAEEVITANGGVDALKILQSDQGSEIDLVVLDVNMPMVDGLTILQMIRDGLTEAAKSVAVAILTGISEEQVVRTAFSLGVDAYVMKPVSKASLGARLAKAVAQRQEIRVSTRIPSHAA